MVYLTCAVIGLGGRGVIKTWTEVAATVRLYLHADVRSHFSGSYAIQSLAASEERCHRYFFIIFFNQSVIFMRCVDLYIQTVFPTASLKLRCQKRRCYMLI